MGNSKSEEVFGIAERYGSINRLYSAADREVRAKTEKKFILDINPEYVERESVDDISIIDHMVIHGSEFPIPLAYIVSGVDYIMGYILSNGKYMVDPEIASAVDISNEFVAKHSI